MVLYWLAHRISLEKMSALYGVGAFTIRKYTYIVCDALFNGDKLFSVYVLTPTWNQLLNIIERFREIIGLQQICGLIDCMHIHLSVKPNKQITSSIIDFYNRKCFHSIVLQVVCDCDIFLECMRWSTRWNGKWRTIQNVKFVSFSSIKIEFAKTNCYYWICVDSTLPTWGCIVSYLAIFIERLQTLK
jgi:hypothetical protein